MAAEAAVQKAIDRIKRGRTTIIIAHRIATLRNADVIGIVHNGRVSPGALDCLSKKVSASVLLHVLVDRCTWTSRGIGQASQHVPRSLTG